MIWIFFSHGNLQINLPGYNLSRPPPLLLPPAIAASSFPPPAISPGTAIALNIVHFQLLYLCCPKIRFPGSFFCILPVHLKQSGIFFKSTMSKINRREFINNSGLFTGGLVTLIAFGLPGPLSGSGGSFHTGAQNTEGDHAAELGIESFPNFCSHEHWGSIASIGFDPVQEGYLCDLTAGAKPQRETSVWDLILDPYQSWWMSSVNKDPKTIARKEGYESLRHWWNISPQKALKAYITAIRPFMLTGGFQCTRRGIQKLYGTDISLFRAEEWAALDLAIAENYSDMFTWHQQAMKNASFSELIRPVHPEFYRPGSASPEKQNERAFTNTVLRIDPLLDMWKSFCPRRESLSAIIGTDPSDARSWREFIAKIFDLAAENHAAGIKQLQAYSRTLLFQTRSDNVVSFRGELNGDEILCFQDWVMHECCRQAHERNWVHQVHVGTNNISQSGPLPLEQLASMYPRMNIVMIHCWPFLKEAGWLAKHVPNIYIDTCWLPVLNPSYFHDALTMWLNYVPLHKIMLGHDSTHIEMATGSSLFTRDILARSLLDQQHAMQVTRADLQILAADMLHNNAVRLYGIGKEFTA